MGQAYPPRPPCLPTTMPHSAPTAINHLSARSLKRNSCRNVTVGGVGPGREPRPNRPPPFLPPRSSKKKCKSGNKHSGIAIQTRYPPFEKSTPEKPSSPFRGDNLPGLSTTGEGQGPPRHSFLIPRPVDSELAIATAADRRLRRRGTSGERQCHPTLTAGPTWTGPAEADGPNPGPGWSLPGGGLLFLRKQDFHVFLGGGSGSEGSAAGERGTGLAGRPTGYGSLLSTAGKEGFCLLD